MDAGRELQIVGSSEVPGEDLFSGLDAFRPESPCCRLLELIHHDSPNVVMFTHKHGVGTKRPRWEEFGAVRVNQLRQLFSDPAFLREIEHDSYFTPLAYEDRIRRSTPSNYRAVSPLLQFVSRKGENLAAFPAVWADLDFYAKGIRRGDAWGGIVNLVDDGAFPAPSLYVSSGQGLWCYWLLTDPNTGRAPVNTADNFSAWHGCLERLHELTKHLGSDKQGQLCSQVSRIPGTLNTRANARVEWYAKLDGHGFVQRYSLLQLATELNVHCRDSHEAWVMANQGRKVEEIVRVRVLDAKHAGRKHGFRSLYLRRFESIRRLAEFRARRGQFVPVGKRRDSAWLYALSLLRSGLCDEIAEVRARHGLTTDPIPNRMDYVRQLTRQYASTFQRGGTGESFNVDREVFTKGWDVPKHRFSDAWIAEIFEPTPEESRYSGMPTYAAARDARQARRARLTRTQKALRVQTAILRVLEANPEAKPSLVAQVCTDVHGVKISERTARNYLRNLRTTGELSGRPMVLPCLPTDPTVN